MTPQQVKESFNASPKRHTFGNSATGEIRAVLVIDKPSFPGRHAIKVGSEQVVWFTPGPLSGIDHVTPLAEFAAWADTTVEHVDAFVSPDGGVVLRIDAAVGKPLMDGFVTVAPAVDEYKLRFKIKEVPNPDPSRAVLTVDDIANMLRTNPAVSYFNIEMRRPE